MDVIDLKAMALMERPNDILHPHVLPDIESSRFDCLRTAHAGASNCVLLWRSGLDVVILTGDVTTARSEDSPGSVHKGGGEPKFGTRVDDDLQPLEAV